MHRRIVSPAPTKLCLWQAPSSKLWTGETDMKIGHLKNFVRSVIDIDEIQAQRTCHTNTSWYCGGREEEISASGMQAKRSEVKQHSSFVC